MLIYSMPLIGALIGWLTNYLAVKMLFHPQVEKKILFFRLQGVFPKRQKAFAVQVGRLVSKEFISTREIIEHLKDKATSDQALDQIATSLAENIAKKLPQGLPMLTRLFNPELFDKIRAGLREPLRDLLRELMTTMQPTLEKDLEVHAIVEEKVASFSCEKLEEIVLKIMRKELRFIELVGGLLGFIIGLGQLGLVLLG